MDINDAMKLMLEHSQNISKEIIRQARETAREANRMTGLDNFGNNMMINALAYSLETILADFADACGKNREEVFKEFHLEFHTFLNEHIARYSKSGKSFMVDVSDQGKETS